MGRSHLERGRGRRKDTDVSVSRVYRGSVYVRVNTIGVAKQRAFVLVPGIGVSSNYFERLAPNLNEYGPVYALDLPGFAAYHTAVSGCPLPSSPTWSGRSSKTSVWRIRFWSGIRWAPRWWSIWRPAAPSSPR